MKAFTLPDTQLRNYLLGQPEAYEGYPFGPEIVVYKVRNKMFALAVPNSQGEIRLNLKCDPQEAQQLRTVFYDCVFPGYHMNKTHWNTLLLNGKLPEAELRRMVDNSYALVVKGMGKTVATRLLGL